MDIAECAYYIITKKARTSPEPFTGDVEMGEYEEIIVIKSISSSESKVFFISKFDFGGKLPGFIKNRIAIDRLKYLA